MKANKKEKYIFSLLLIAVSAFSLVFVTVMGFLNYRSLAIEMETQVIGRVEGDMVSKVETALSFGKTFDKYYGIEDVFESFSAQYKGPTPFIIDRNGELLYVAEGSHADKNVSKVIRFVESGEFELALPKLSEKEGKPVISDDDYAVFSPIHEGEELVGYFGCVYTRDIFSESFDDIRKSSRLICSILIIVEICAILWFVSVVRSEKWLSKTRTKRKRRTERIVSALIVGCGILVLSGLLLNTYQKDYRNRIESSVKKSLGGIEETVSRVGAQGVDLRELDDLDDYLKKKAVSLNFLKSVELSEDISKTENNKDYITFELQSGSAEGRPLYLEAKISKEAINKESRNLIMVIVSTMVILLIFVFELNNLVELSSAGQMEEGKRFPERQVSLSLRFTGFLMSSAECMCVPYAAMLIRESGESLFGLSVGMTAALPLTLESIAQMLGMLTLPALVKRINVKKVMLLSAVLMIGCNMTAFITGGALMIVICRGLAGIAYSGFKQVSNFLITSGYESEEGRAENISQDNAGLLAGATCGAGLGAILSANAGYSMTFLFSSVVFLLYLIATAILPPWKLLGVTAAEKNKKGEKKSFQVGNILRVLKSREMLAFILLIGIPLNIGVMLCVTLVPAVCQTKGISSVMLSYCYIANGLAGIYIGPALVSKAKMRFGLKPSISFAFLLTGISIFILHLPPVAIMIVITSMVLGFLDGFGTPMVMDRFMDLDVIKREMDESGALIFAVVMSYVLLTFAPVVAELLILPGKGFITPMMVGAIVYCLAAVFLVTFKGSKNKERETA
ncbi:MAG: MFS transporter [Lachnospiraceae bacterium]|nr:MFS transporter [Lachnospiraceae bacterium]